jgi:hypothetical protein
MFALGLERIFKFGDGRTCRLSRLLKELMNSTRYDRHTVYLWDLILEKRLSKQNL